MAPPPPAHPIDRAKIMYTVEIVSTGTCEMAGETMNWIAIAKKATASRSRSESCA